MTFDEIYRQHRSDVRHRVLSVVGPERVEDATQDAWIRIWRGLPTYNGTAALSSWMYRVATNAAIDSLRRHRRRNRRLEFHADLLELEDLAPDPALTPAARCVVQRELDAALAAVDALPPIYRSVVNLVYLDELKLEDAAAQLGISTGAVKSRLHRARHKLAHAVHESAGQRAPVHIST